MEELYCILNLFSSLHREEPLCRVLGTAKLPGCHLVCAKVNPERWS